MEFWVASENATRLPPKAPVPVCPRPSSLPPAWSCRHPEHRQTGGEYPWKRPASVPCRSFHYIPDGPVFPGEHTSSSAVRALAGT